MSMLGMNIESVQMLVNALDNAANNEIPAIIQNITTALNNTQWVGTDRNTFEADWNGMHVPQLRQLAGILENIAGTARNEIAQQEQASAT